MANQLIIFYIVYGAFLFMSFIKGPHFGIYLYQMMYFLTPWDKWWWNEIHGIRWVFIVGVITAISFIIRIKEYHFIKIINNKTVHYMSLFLILMIIVGFYAVWQDRHWEIMHKQIATFIYVFIFIICMNTEKKIIVSIWIYLSGIFYCAFIAWDQGRTGFGRLENVGPVDSSEANDLAAVFVSAIPILLVVILKEKNILLKALAVVFFVFIMNGMILVNSRGGIVGLVCVAPIFLYFCYKSKYSKMVIILTSILAFSSFVYLADQIFYDRFSTIKYEINTPEESRIVIWKIALKEIVNYPFGAGAFGFNHISKSLPEFYREKAIHNTFIQVLFDFGIFGFSLFISILALTLKNSYSLFKTLKNSYEIKKYLIGIICGLTGFLICCIFLDRLYAELLWYQIAFLSAIIKVSKEKKV